MTPQMRMHQPTSSSALLRTTLGLFAAPQIMEASSSGCMRRRRRPHGGSHCRGWRHSSWRACLQPSVSRPTASLTRTFSERKCSHAAAHHAVAFRELSACGSQLVPVSSPSLACVSPFANLIFAGLRKQATRKRARASAVPHPCPARSSARPPRSRQSTASTRGASWIAWGYAGMSSARSSGTMGSAGATCPI